jgi:hypothetical protein
MFFKRLLETVGDVAPTVAGLAATALSGGNPAAGALVGSVIKKILGKEPQSAADLEDMARDILGDPEKIQQFRMAMRQAELEELRIRALDVQDARKTLDKSSGAVWISLFVVIAYTIAMTIAMTTVIPAGSQNLAYLLLGNLATGFGMVLTFWLGSSVGSKEKTAILQKYADAAKADQSARINQ